MNIEKMNLSFSGCGFLCIYHAGVAAAIKEYAPQLTRNRVSGASAGAVVAAGLLCNVSISEATSTILKVVCQARAGTLQALSPTFDLMGLLREGLDRTLPANAHTICSGHLFISLTRARDYKNVVVCEFDSREELLQAIICSCFIPFYCGRDPPKYRGEAYIDGGCSDNQPIYDKSTITVSPFSGESDICPTDIDSASLLGFYFAGTSIRFTTQNLFRLMVVLFPPAQDICSKICRQGFEDALRFLTKNGITPCIRCLTIQSDALPVPQHDHALPSLRHRNRSFGNRRRLDSECGKCFSSLDSSHSLPTMPTTLFPEIMQQTLEQAQVTESRLYRNLQYIASFRLVRWSLKLMTPVTLPLEFLLLTLKTFKEWIASSSKTDFFVQRLQAIVDFILGELEKQRILYNPLVSVPMAISYATSAYPSSPRANAKATVSHMDAGHRHDRRSNAPVDVHMEYDVDDDDSMAQLVDYSTQHDAVLEFYYTNEKTNQVEVCEIFDMRNPRLARNQPGARQRRARAAAASSALMEQDEREANSEPSTSGVFSEENSVNAERQHLAKVESPVPGEDSGLSLTEDSSNGLTVKKRDACCSPVRHFGPTRAIQRTNSQRSSASSSSRRHTLAGSRRTPSSSLHSLHSTKSTGQQSSGASSSKHRPNPLSSDSDADAGEAFFVSNPRKRTSSGEYDGEPESSDQ